MILPRDFSSLSPTIKTTVTVVLAVFLASVLCAALAYLLYRCYYRPRLQAHSQDADIRCRALDTRRSIGNKPQPPLSHSPISRKGWDTLPSNDDLNSLLKNGQSKLHARHKQKASGTHASRPLQHKSPQRRRWPFKHRKHLSAIMESPVSQSRSPIAEWNMSQKQIALYDVQPGTALTTPGEFVVNPTNGRFFAEAPLFESPRSDILPTTGLRPEPLLSRTDMQKFGSTDRHPAYRLSVERSNSEPSCVGSQSEKNMHPEVARIRQSRIHSRSMSRSSTFSAKAPLEPPPPLPLNYNRSSQRPSMISRMSSQETVSTLNSSSSSILNKISVGPNSARDEFFQRHPSFDLGGQLRQEDTSLKDLLLPVPQKVQTRPRLKNPERFHSSHASIRLVGGPDSLSEPGQRPVLVTNNKRLGSEGTNSVKTSHEVQMIPSTTPYSGSKRTSSSSQNVTASGSPVERSRSSSSLMSPLDSNAISNKVGEVLNTQRMEYSRPPSLNQSVRYYDGSSDPGYKVQPLRQDAAPMDIPRPQSAMSVRSPRSSRRREPEVGRSGASRTQAEGSRQSTMQLGVPRCSTGVSCRGPGKGIYQSSLDPGSRMTPVVTNRKGLQQTQNDSVSFLDGQAPRPDSCASGSTVTISAFPSPAKGIPRGLLTSFGPSLDVQRLERMAAEENRSGDADKQDCDLERSKQMVAGRIEHLRSPRNENTKSCGPNSRNTETPRGPSKPGSDELDGSIDLRCTKSSQATLNKYRLPSATLKGTFQSLKLQQSTRTSEDAACPPPDPIRQTPLPSSARPMKSKIDIIPGEYMRPSANSSRRMSRIPDFNRHARPESPVGGTGQSTEKTSKELRRKDSDATIRGYSELSINLPDHGLDFWPDGNTSGEEHSTEPDATSGAGEMHPKESTESESSEEEGTLSEKQDQRHGEYRGDVDDQGRDDRSSIEGSDGAGSFDFDMGQDAFTPDIQVQGASPSLEHEVYWERLMDESRESLHSTVPGSLYDSEGFLRG